MGNPGIPPGLAFSSWRTYDPQLRAFSFSGTGITQPILSDPRQRKGEFCVTNQGIVVGWAQITLVSGDAFGSGENVWAISLPRPTIGQIDLPIGTALLWQGAAADPQGVEIGLVTPMDPLPPGGQQGAQASYAQVILSRLVSWGTAAFTSGSTVVTVTHNLGETPVAYDINLIGTNTPSTSPGAVWVDTITSTTFNINIRSSSTTTPATYAWKIDAEPNGTALYTPLMSSKRPWTWAAGMSIGINFEYKLG